jgi:hypothetical protein
MDPATPITLVTARYATLPQAVRDHDAVWGVRRDGAFHHTSIAVLAPDVDGALQVECDDSTAACLTWGAALLGGALSILVPSVGGRGLPPARLPGARAVIGHLQDTIPEAELVPAARVLDDCDAGLVVVVVNRPREAVTALLGGADRTCAVATVWGNLEQELARDLGRPPLVLAASGGRSLFPR